MKKFKLHVAAPGQLDSPQEAIDILDLLCNVHPDLVPEYYGYYEPLREIFDEEHVQDILRRWAWELTILWKRRMPHLEGSVHQPWGARHGYLTVSVTAKQVEPAILIHFLKTVALRLRTDFALLHLSISSKSPRDFGLGTAGCAHPNTYIGNLFVTTHQLENYIPDLYWATVLGPPYIEHFGRDRILSSPAPIVSELSEECIYIQLSENPFDLEKDFSAVEATGRRVKEHLNCNSFFDPKLPATHTYSVPKFELDPK